MKVLLHFRTRKLRDLKLLQKSDENCVKWLGYNQDFENLVKLSCYKKQAKIVSNSLGKCGF